MLIIDNMTLQGAARLLEAQLGCARPVTSAHRGAKWDYAANRDLQVAVDVACLAQVCQAVVLHGQATTTAGFSDRWRDSRLSALPASSRCRSS